MKTYYATPQMVKDYHKLLIKRHQHVPDFAKSLQQMEQEGLLSETPLPVPELFPSMSKEAFMTAFDKIPIPVKDILENVKPARDKHHSIPFPKQFDLVCVQHVCGLDYEDQKIANAYAVTYLFAGQSDVLLQDTSIQLKPGDIFIATPGYDYQIASVPGTFSFEVLVNVDYFEVQFADFFTEYTVLSDFFRESSVQKKTGNYCVIHTGKDDAVRYYLQATACEFTNRKLYTNTCAIGNLKFALVTAFRNHAEAIDIFNNMSRRSGPDAEEIIKYMQTNYRTISLSQTAEKFHYNSAYISRLLYAHYQKTFMEILTEIRLQRAKDYLNKTSKDIAEIATVGGLYFLRAFFQDLQKESGTVPVGIPEKREKKTSNIDHITSYSEFFFQRPMTDSHSL